MSEEFGQSEEYNKTQWSGAGFTNARIHDMIQFLNKSVLNRDIFSATQTLDMINQELYPFEDKDEKQSIKEKIKALKEKVNYHLQSMNSSKIPSRFKKQIPAEIMDEISEIRYDLSDIFNKSGLQTIMSDDPNNAFLG
jgi:hypothetical protein